MELKHRDRIVQIKIVYYGPAIGGKTTNLQMLHAAAAERHRGEFISVNSPQDRTILFDLLPLKGVGFHGFEIRFQLVAVPGQTRFATTRRLVVRGADAVVFVANSAIDRLHENVKSVREMADYLVANNLDPATIPLVFQYNKRDLPEVLSSGEMENALGYREAPVFPAVAVRGEGVLETLRGILEQTMDNLMARYPSLSLGSEETVESWTRQMLHNVFGRASIVMETPSAAPPSARAPNRRIVRVAVPLSSAGEAPARTASNSSQADAPGPAADQPAEHAEGTPAGPASRAKEPGLAATYAQASMDLSVALDRIREERDEARRRLEELEHTLRAIEAEEQGRSAKESLTGALERIVVGGGCRAATLLAAGPDRTFTLVTGVGLGWDPLLRLEDGQQIVRNRFVPLQEPLLLQVETDEDLARAVEPLHPPAQALVAVPIRSALGLHGLVMLYFSSFDPRPPAAALTHLHNMGRVLAAWFSVKRASAVGSTLVAIRRTLPQLESAARSALEHASEAERDPLVAGASLEKVVRALDGVLELTTELARPTGRPAPPARPL